MELYPKLIKAVKTMREAQKWFYKCPKDTPQKQRALYSAKEAENEVDRVLKEIEQYEADKKQKNLF